MLAKQTEIESLNLLVLVLKLKRMHFGQRSEKMNADIGQLELRLEDFEVNPLPAELPREIETIAPKQEACPDCGARCVRSGKTFPRCWSTFRRASKSSAR